MDTDEIITQVNDIFKDVFDDDSLSIGYETSAADIADWDSLTHIELIVAIEKHFKIRFTSSEIQTFNNVGEMSESIAAKLKKV